MAIYCTSGSMSDLMARLIFIPILFFLIFFPVYSQNSSDNMLRRIVAERGQAEVTMPLPGNDPSFITNYVSIVSIRDGLVSIKLSPLTVEWFISQKFRYTVVPYKSPDYQAPLTAKGAMQWDSYPTYIQYDSIMRSFVSQYPSLCRLDTIGTTNYGKLVLVLKISDNVSEDEDEPEVFYTSSMHGDETGGFILMLRLAAFLLENYASDTRITDLVENLQIWINPLANPDGMYRTGNTISSPTRFNANGVDLNRNFPDPDIGTVKQKETLDMISFLKKRRFVLSANFHSGAEVVNYPWDKWLDRRHADDTWFYNISREYADTVHQYGGPIYMHDFDNGVVRGAVWYVINGGRQDYVTRELQGREVTIELDNDYITPAAELETLWINNYRSLLGYLENALHGIHGQIIDSETSDPVPARIFIAGHDMDSSHVYSDTLHGSFVRMLSPGTWDLSFSARGYRDTIVENVEVYENQRTDLTVLMTPDRNSPFSSSPLLYPNPASSVIRALPGHNLTGTVRVNIFNSTGRLMGDFETEVRRNIPVELDISRLAQGIYFIRFISKSEGITSTGKFYVIR
jgi:hypothetical protein